MLQKNVTCYRKMLFQCSTPARSEQPSSLEQSTNGETRVAAVWQLLRPLGLCHDLLTPHTVTTYLLPVLVSYQLDLVYAYYSFFGNNIIVLNVLNNHFVLRRRPPPKLPCTTCIALIKRLNP